jgi:hypothetical protein
LHECAWFGDSVEVLQFVIDKFPNALVCEDFDGMTPLAYCKRNAAHQDNPAAILRCLEDDSTDKYLALENQITVKLCLVRLKKEGMTEYVANIPSLNDLTREQFVFMPTET